MTHQFPHPHTTLPGHDASKVRDCITESASEALDVRVLQVAEKIADEARIMDDARPLTAGRLRVQAHILRAIAAEIRDAATPRRPVAKGSEIAEHLRWAADEIAPWVVLTADMQDRQSLIIKFLQALALDVTGAAPTTRTRRPAAECNEIIAIWNTDTVTQLRDVWAGSSARRPEMEPVERIRLLEKAMGRFLVIEARHEGDGR